MARDIVFDPPTRGLSIVRPAARLGTTECCRAENVNFTTTSVRRRKGKKAAYSNPNQANASRVTALKRFYDLATTGTVTKKFFIATDKAGDALWCPTSDWSDDTASPITGFTEQVFPNSPTTLYLNGYVPDNSATAITADQIIREIVQAHSWVYFCPSFDVTGNDDNDNNLNEPMRGQGNGSVYLHGLVPPAALVADDVTGVKDIPASTSWVGADIDSNTPTQAGPGCLRLGLDGRIHAAYIRGGTPYYNVRSTAGTWGTPTQVSAVAMGVTYGALSMDLDDAGYAHIAFYDAVNTQIYYATNRSGSFVAEIADTTGSVGVCNSIAVDMAGLPHIVYNDSTNTRLIHRSRSVSGVWSAATAIETVATCEFYPAAEFDAQGRLHVVYEKNPNVGNSDIRYAVRSAAGSWSSPVDVQSTADNIVYPVAIAIDSGDNPGALYHNTTNTDLMYAKYNGSSWDTAEIVDSSASMDSCALAFDADDVAHVFYEDNNQTYYNNRQGGTWDTAVNISGGTPLAVLGIAVASDFSIHVGWTATTSVEYATVTRILYHYRLTAEYDDGILGESGPSAALAVGYDNEVSAAFAHTLDLDDSGGRYDMTTDVTRIYVYRTVNGSGEDGTYYRVGYVTCTSGAPTGDFVDNVSDADLVSPTNKILDTDKYLPPRWKTAAYWKDRLVIGNLKCRDTNDTNQLDVEQGGIHKNRVRYSSAFTPDVYKANFFQDIIPDGGSGSIQKLIVNPLTDTLYVLMENDVVALVGSPLGDPAANLSFPIRNVAGSKGTPSPQSVLQYDGRVFYWTKHGIEMIYGLEGRNITSDTIGVLWNLLDTAHPRYTDRVKMSRLSSVCGAAYVDSVGERILWAYTSGDQASATNDRILCLHYGLWKQRGFQGDPPYSIYTGWLINAFAAWDGEGDRGELFGGEGLSTQGAWTYRLEFDNEDDLGTLGTNGTAVTIAAVQPWYIWTPLYDGGRPDKRKSWMATRLTGKADTIGGVTYPIEMILDVNGGGLTPTIDTIAWADGTDRMYLRALPRVAQGPRCGLRLKGTDSLVVGDGHAPFELYGLAFLVDDLHMSSRVRGSG